MIKSGFPVRNQRVMVAGSGPLLLAVAAEVKKQGGQVVAIAEQASWRSLLHFCLTLGRYPGKIVQGMSLGYRTAPTSYLVGWWPVEARGKHVVEQVVLTNGRETCEYPCDVLACAYGLVPNDELARLCGAVCRNGEVAVDEYRMTSQPDIYAAGELTGVAGVEGAVVEGRIAGLSAADQKEKAVRFFARRRGWQKFQNRMARGFALRPELKQLVKNDTIICRCEDVTWEDLQVQDSFLEAKLQKRCGMGNCQGRICGSAVGFLKGWESVSVRPPVLPVRLSTLYEKFS